jgi:hypothetical protein
MKYKKPKSIKFNLSSARRSLKAARRFKRYKKTKNTNSIGKSEVSQKLTNIKQKFAYLGEITVPRQFSFLTNANRVIAFISNLKNHYDNRRAVFIEMEKVQLIDYSAIVVLLSIMVKFKTEKIKFNGDFPINPEVNNLFVDSGFFQILNIPLLKNRDKFDFGSPNAIHTHASKNVDPAIGPNIMRNISMNILSHLAVYKGLQRTLIELMQNSFNHAEPAKEGDKHWWLSVNVNTKLKTASFSFIDYGIGVFESLNSKGPESKWYDWKNLIAPFNAKSNAEILKLILEGKLHKTVTGQDFRGKGLPGIKEAMDRNLISKLFIITNDVYANVSENIYLTLSNNFTGTFVYWEINEFTTSHTWNL